MEWTGCISDLSSEIFKDMIHAQGMRCAQKYIFLKVPLIILMNSQALEPWLTASKRNVTPTPSYLQTPLVSIAVVSQTGESRHQQATHGACEHLMSHGYLIFQRGVEITIFWTYWVKEKFYKTLVHQFVLIYFNVATTHFRWPMWPALYFFWTVLI